MKKQLISGILVATLLTSVAVPAFAAGGHDGKRGPHEGRNGPPIERILERFDANGDGAITPDEALQHRADIFASADADKDGELTTDELDQLRRMQMEERMEMRSEMGRHDDDRRGMGRHGMDDDDRERGEYGERRGWGHGKMGQGKMGYGKMGRQGHHGPDFSRLDADGNGSLSIEEFTANSERMFDRFDRNGDGKITRDDFDRKRADAGPVKPAPNGQPDKAN